MFPGHLQVLFIALSCMKILACVVLRAMVLENDERYGEAFEAEEFYYRAAAEAAQRVKGSLQLNLGSQWGLRTPWEWL